MPVRSPLFWGLILALGSGVLLRLNFAGILSEILIFDWYRAHTHAGYYLFFLPLILWKQQTVLRQKVSWYFSLLTILIFLLQGYSLLAKIFSGIVFVIWLLEIGLKTFSRDSKKYQWPLLAGMMLSLIFLLSVIYLPRINSSVSAASAARAFLSALLFGVIVPYILQFQQKISGFLIIVYQVGLLAYGCYIMGLAPSEIGAFFGVILACILGQVTSKKIYSFLLWLPVSAGLFLLPLISESWQQIVAVAGVHYIFLGAILLSLFRLQSVWLRKLYFYLVLIT